VTKLLAAIGLSLALCATALGGAQRNVDLLAAFKPKLATCGGSCAPNSFWFIHEGYLYGRQAKDLRAPEKANLTRMANQAIAAGAR